jgi:hypothetical protein
MEDAFYSQRTRHRRRLPETELGSEFLTAFAAYLDRLKQQDYLCSAFPNQVCDGYPGGIDNLAAAAQYREDLGYNGWLFNPLQESTEHVLDLVEFVFAYVSKPTEVRYHDFCQGSHPTGEYDTKQARYEYTIQINRIFSRFNHPYRLQKGRVIKLSSELLDRVVYSTEFSIDDAHLRELIQTATELFGDRSGNKKIEAVRSIVGAFERVKTLEGMDKRKSVETVLARISPNQEIRSLLDQHLRNMTDLANRSTIRHHERDRAELRDPQVLEYLFYTYYNLVRLILQKYGGAT